MKKQAQQGLLQGKRAERAEGTRRIYRLNPAGVAALRDQLDTFWHRALAGYQEVLDRTEDQLPDRSGQEKS